MKVQIVGRQKINDSNGIPFTRDEDLRALDGIVRGPVIEVSQISDVFDSDTMKDFETQHPNYSNITIEKVEDEHFITVHHPMTKTHFISFIVYLTPDRVQFVKLYPEGNAETRLNLRGRGYLYRA